MAAFGRSGLVAGFVLAAALPAAAQQARPPVIHLYRGLFGPTESEERLNKRLFLSMSIYTAADDTSRFDPGAAIADSALQENRLYQGANAQLTFHRQRPRALWRLTAGAGLRSCPTLRDVTTSQYRGALAGQLTPAQHWRVQVTGSGGYTPFFRIRPEPGLDPVREIPVPASEPATSLQKVIDGSGAVTVSYAPTRATEWQIDGGGSRSLVVGAPDFTAASAGMRVVHRLSRDWSLRLGYADGLSQRADAGRIRLQHIDAGLSFDRGVVLSPRTSIGFSSGSAIASLPEGARFELVGSGFMKVILSQRWSVQAVGARSLQSLAVTPRPFVTDSASAMVSGYLARRVGIRMTPACSRGVDVSVAASRFHSCSANTHVQFALDRFWALDIEHAYDAYAFSPAADVSLQRARMTGQGARVGLTLWSPLVR